MKASGVLPASGENAMKAHELFVYLSVKSAAEAAAFYKNVFGAKETLKLVEPSGKVGHLELSLAGSTLMIAEEYPELNFVAPGKTGVTSVRIHLHVDDADAWIDRALKAGATLVRPLEDHFYGERSGTIRDPFGFYWLIGHSIEKVTPEEMQRRYTALFDPR